MDETCDEVSGQCVTGILRTWVVVYAGMYIMGSPEDELGRFENETQHQVTLTRDFVILSTEVTQRDFEDVMGYHTSFFSQCGDDCPVEKVSWHEAAAYCNALSDLEGYSSCYSCSGSGLEVACEIDISFPIPYNCPGYRLPTEAEWEYAARAGTVEGTYNGDLEIDRLECERPNFISDPIAWFCGNTYSTQLVGLKEPNAWGLYDMLGNVWEWCHDWYGDYTTDPVTDPYGIDSGAHRVVRGGGWTDGARIARSPCRNGYHYLLRGSLLGFRPVRTLP